MIGPYLAIIAVWMWVCMVMSPRYAMTGFLFIPVFIPLFALIDATCAALIFARQALLNLSNSIGEWENSK